MSEARGEDALDGLVDDRDLARTRSSVLAGLFGRKPTPTLVGRFELLGSLGAGAMGQVYLAQDPRLDRGVALKLIKPQIAAAASAARYRRRLLAEARSLAALNHPNIVEVFEFGTDADEIFLAMELVDGADVRRWLGSRDRTADEIISVFAAAGSGLVAAHEAGIVHRDFKPDNVLVGNDGRVKVADFGLASANPDSADSAGDRRASTVTSRSTHAGTPDYMAPELFDGGRANAQTDQFAFCVSLAESLTGQRVRDPSRADSLEAPPRVAAVLRRGLDPDPERRFDSMQQLLAALTTQRSRRGWWLAVAAASAIGAFAFADFDASATPTCSSADELTSEVWDEPRRQSLAAALTRTAPTLGADTWALAEPRMQAHFDALGKAHETACQRQQQGDPATALDPVHACVRSRLDALDRTLVAIEAGDIGIEHVIGALDGLRPAAPCTEKEVDPASTQAQLEDEARLREARALVQAGSPEGAALARQIRERALGRKDERLASAATLQLGRAATRRGKGGEALELYESAYFGAAAADDDATAARAAAVAAFVALRYHHDPTAARTWSEHAHAKLARTPDARIEAELEHWLALIAYDQHAYDDSLAHADRGLELAGNLEDAEVLGSDLLMARANAEIKLGQLGKARADLESAAGSRSAHFGATHPKTVAVAGQQGVLAFRDGRFEDARALLEGAIGTIETELGPDHVVLGDLLSSLGAVQGETGDGAASVQSLERAVAIQQAAYGDGHPKIAKTLINYSEALAMSGKVEKATQLRLGALATLEATLGPDNAEVARAYNAMGDFYSSAAKTDKAIAAHQHALQIDDAASFSVPDVRVQAYFGLARAVGPDDPKQAIKYLQKGAAVADEVAGEQHLDHALALTNLGALLVLDGRPAEALEPSLRAVEKLEAAVGPDHPNIAYALLAAADGQIAHGRHTEAVHLAERAVELRENAKGLPKYLLARAQVVLVRALWPVDRKQANALEREVRATLVAAGERGEPGLQELDTWKRSRRNPRNMSVAP